MNAMTKYVVMTKEHLDVFFVPLSHLEKKETTEFDFSLGRFERIISTSSID